MSFSSKPQLRIFRPEQDAFDEDISSPANASPSNEENVLGQFIPLHYHFNMLQDVDRVNAFRDAISLLVKPGMHVVELGGGTGILSSLAARAGAAVTCVERNPELVATSRRLVELNGLGQQINVVAADAAEFQPDRPVDVVICEMLHVGLLREKQAAVIAAFKNNYIAKFGDSLPIFIPEVSMLMVQAVEQDFRYAGYNAPVTLFQAPLVQHARTIDLSELSIYAQVDYRSAIADRYEIAQSFLATADGRVNAIRFVTQNVMAVDVENQRAITWPNQYLVMPLDQPFLVQRNAEIQVEFNYAAGGTLASLASTLRSSSETQRVSKAA
jgi:predicted RNA methylase